MTLMCEERSHRACQRLWYGLLDLSDRRSVFVGGGLPGVGYPV